MIGFILLFCLLFIINIASEVIRLKTYSSVLVLRSFVLSMIATSLYAIINMYLTSTPSN